MIGEHIDELADFSDRLWFTVYDAQEYNEESREILNWILDTIPRHNSDHASAEEGRRGVIRDQVWEDLQ